MNDDLGQAIVGHCNDGHAGHGMGRIGSLVSMKLEVQLRFCVVPSCIVPWSDFCPFFLLCD